jgi:Putative zinc-finger
VTSLDSFAHDDGAYVLGALSSDERTAFERHLLTCTACTGRVRELAALPALLAGLPTGAYTDDAHDSPPASLLPSLLEHLRSQRRRRHWLTAGLAGLAAACVLALAVVAWPTRPAPAPRVQAASFQSMTEASGIVNSPLHATAAVVAVKWGTQIRLACRYDAADTPGVDYLLVVVDKDNVAHPAGSWKLSPGAVAHFTGGTALRSDQISKVEIAVGNRPILELKI